MLDGHQKPWRRCRRHLLGSVNWSLSLSPGQYCTLLSPTSLPDDRGSSEFSGPKKVIMLTDLRSNFCGREE